MTKEPIMIDDVNVAECEYFSSGLGYCDIGLWANNGTHICECEQNCYYKQLKRKEQECEELLKFNNSLVEEHKTIGNDLYKEIKDYRIKLEQLKVKEEELVKYRPIIDRLLQQFETYDKLKSLDVVTFAKQTFAELDQLKAENEEFKKTVHDLLLKSEIQDKILWKIDNEALLGSKDAYIYKLKQALQEIKKIAEDDCKTCTVKLLGEDKINCKRCYRTKILQKCEVLDD